MEVTFVVEGSGEWYMVCDRTPVKRGCSNWRDFAQVLHHVGTPAHFLCVDTLEDPEGEISKMEVLELRLENESDFLADRTLLTAKDLGLSV